MKNIADFLAKFKIIPDPKKEKVLILGYLQEFFTTIHFEKLDFTDQNIEIKGNNLQIKAHPVLKNLIFSKKADLIEFLNIKNKETQKDLIYKDIMFI